MYVNGLDLTLHPKKTVLISLIPPGGATESGLFVQRHTSVPSIMGLVIDCSPDVVDAGEVKVDDVVIFRPYTYEEFDFEGQTFNIISVNDILSVIEGYPEEYKYV